MYLHIDTGKIDRIHSSLVYKIDIQFGCSEPQYDIYWNDTQS